MSKTFAELMKERVESTQPTSRIPSSPPPLAFFRHNLQNSIQMQGLHPIPVPVQPVYPQRQFVQIGPPPVQLASVEKARVGRMVEEVKDFSTKASPDDMMRINELKNQLKSKSISQDDFFKSVFALRDQRRQIPVQTQVKTPSTSSIMAELDVSPDLKNLVQKYVTLGTTNEERKKMLQDEPELIPFVKQIVELKKRKLNETGNQTERQSGSSDEARIKDMMREIDLSPHLTHLCQRYADAGYEERKVMLEDYSGLRQVIVNIINIKKNSQNTSLKPALKQKREENDIGDNSTKRRKSETNSDLDTRTMGPDVTIKVQDSTFHLNRNVLSQHSDFFKVGLSVRWGGSNQQVISLNGEDGEVDDVRLMELIFRLISNKEARVSCMGEISIEQIVPLLELSDKYQFHLVNWVVVEWCLANMENSLKQWKDSGRHWVPIINILEERIQMIAHDRELHVCYEDVIAKFRRSWRSITHFERTSFEQLIFLHQYMDCKATDDYDLLTTTLLSWVKFDVSSRLQYVDEFIKLIQFKAISPALAWSLVKLYPFLSDHMFFLQTFHRMMNPYRTKSKIPKNLCGGRREKKN